MSSVVTSTGAVIGSTGSIQPGVTPNIYNITLITAATEYSQALTGVKKITVKNRNKGNIKFAFISV